MKDSRLDEVARVLEDLGKRVKALEDEVFPRSGGGFGAELKQIHDRLQTLEEEIVVRTATIETDLGKKFKELVRIVAELKEMVVKLEASSKPRAKEMAGFA